MKQLEEARRYVSQLGRDHFTPNGPPLAGSKARSFLAKPATLAVLAVLVVAAAVAAGMVIGGARAHPAAAARTAVATATTGAAAASASRECRDAVDRANRSVQAAAKLETSLRDNATRIMNDRIANKISRDDATTQGLRVLVDAAGGSSAFDTALADYHRVVDRCRLGP